MTYVEWLRVLATLKWTALVGAVLIGLLLVARISLLDIGGQDIFGIVQVDRHDLGTFQKTAKITNVTLPDGTRRTIAESADGNLRVTTDDRGYWGGKHVEIFERNAPMGSELHKLSMGDLTFERTTVAGGQLITVENTKPEDITYYFLVACGIALIVGTILAAPFGRENEGHLELALTKPIDRVKLSIAIIGVDLAGIVAAWLMAVLFMTIAHTILEPPRYYFGPYAGTLIALGLAASFAWYAMLNAATASMKRAYGFVLGLGWLGALLVSSLAKARFGDTIIAQVLHSTFAGIAFFDPLAYLRLGPAVMASDIHMHESLPGTPEISILLVLSLVYCAAAVIQWRRVEA